MRDVCTSIFSTVTTIFNRPNPVPRACSIFICIWSGCVCVCCSWVEAAGAAKRCAWRTPSWGARPRGTRCSTRPPPWRRPWRRTRTMSCRHGSTNPALSRRRPFRRRRRRRRRKSARSSRRWSTTIGWWSLRRRSDGDTPSARPSIARCSPCWTTIDWCSTTRWTQTGASTFNTPHLSGQSRFHFRGCSLATNFFANDIKRR